jgi:UDP:flavonoid glycosyltransferase YjiC (YdhE family)
MLFAWELGGGLGHLARLAPWISHFARRGIEPMLAVRDLHAAAQVPAFAVPLVLQAPFLPYGPFKAGFNAISYPEILLEAGFGNAATLDFLARAWRSLFRLGQVDALVADFSPAAMLAARLARIPILHLGDGFTVPPDEDRRRTFDSVAASADSRSRNASERVLACVNTVLKAGGAAPWQSVAELHAAADTVLATYPELDHYRGCARSTGYFGHVEIPAEDNAGWRPVPGPRILAYLKPTAPEFEATVEVLRRLPAQTRIYASGVVRADESASGVGLAWHAAPMAFASAAMGADLVVSNAGHGATCASLLAGKPLCLLPTVHEQLLTARNVGAIGAGETLLQVRDPRRIRRAIVRCIDDPGLRAAAQDFASRHSAQASSTAVRLAEIADRFLELVNRREAA